MTTQVFLAKYLGDPKRREPRNIGVLISSPLGFAAQFRGTDPGRFSVRNAPFGLPKDVYEAWVNFFVHVAKRNDQEFFDRLLRGRPTEFYLDRSVVEMADLDPSTIIDQYFRELVSSSKDKRAKMEDQVEDLLALVGASYSKDVSIKGEDPKGPQEVMFEFEVGAYLGGILRGQRRELRQSAEAYAYRASTVTSSTRDKFLSFALLTGTEERDYRVAERFGPVVDPYEDDAPRKLADILNG